jgi:hexosaminidase
LRGQIAAVFEQVPQMNPVRLLATVMVLAAVLNSGFGGPALPHAIMPAPASYRAGEGRLEVDGAFSVFVEGHDDARLRAGLSRALRRWEARTGLTFARTDAANAAAAKLVIRCDGPGAAIPQLGDDESYHLAITSERAAVQAATVVGVLRSLETLLQMLDSDAAQTALPNGRVQARGETPGCFPGGGFFVPAAVIEDAPRFPWRGLMVDVCRHWQPMEVIKRTLDGMALVRLNVLHLHLTEDQGFRIESKTFPRLHTLGSDGHYFTQEEMREVIAYAAERGIRVVPEFDLPGHATSWLVGHPELGSQPGPYAIERRWGIFDPTLDPTNEAVYELLDGFLGEMEALFPDPYLHIGGDENNGKHWDANPRIQAFIKKHGLVNNAGLQAYFNRRVLAILARHGKRMVGWDEILHPDLPRDAVVHSWQGPKGLAAAARAGHATILSNGYYIDLSHPAWEHYLNDPLPADTTLTPTEQARVLGGEATMWAEWVTPETIDSRIWPRTAAIAERLWSPREVREVDDMYRRLDIVSLRLEELGLSLTRHVDPMLRRLAGDGANAFRLEELRTIADLVEPVKDYRRGGQQPDATQFTPLTGLVDCARPDSTDAREFSASVRARLFEGSAEDWARIMGWFVWWDRAADNLRQELSVSSPRVRALEPLFSRISEVCAVGSHAIGLLDSSEAPPGDWMAKAFADLDAAAVAFDACEIPIIPVVRLLVAAAGSQPERKTMTAEAWRAHVEALAQSAPAADERPAH